MASKKDLKLVSFDDGGILGFSQLEIMSNVMHRIHWNEKSSGLDKRSLPCEHFDLIGGSGTGGLIAILFGKLQMSVEEASDAFCTIIEQAYTPTNLSASERTEALRRCMEDSMRKKGLPVDLQLMGKQQVGYPCFVVASPRANSKSKLCLRTYPVRSQLPSAITVVDAVLATCATQPDFSSVHSGSGLKKREYVSSSGAANPVHEVITEAHLLFGGDAKVVSLLSLGTGHPGTFLFPPLDGEATLLKKMCDIMQDCEQKAQEVEQWIGRERFYSRLSVEQGLQNNHLEQIYIPNWIVTQTEDYLNLEGTCDRLDLLVQNMNGQTGTFTLDHLKHIGGTKASDQIAASMERSLDILISNQDDSVIAKLRPVDLDCGPHASGCLDGTRQDILEIIGAWGIDTNAPNILWINGYPGVGKSTIAASIVEQWHSSGRLGSIFFFRRDRAEAMTPQSLWRSVAYDLSRRYPTIREHVIATLTKDEALPTTFNVDTLFRQLIQDPLEASSDIPIERLPIIVIDALDECGGFDGRHSDHRKGLLRTLKSWSSLPSRFKLVVTSRRENDIERMFSSTPHQSLCILAGRDTSSQSSNDIQLFLRHGIREIVSQCPSMPTDWPGEEDIWRLTELASGLFIYIKTVIKLLERGEPESTLRQVLGGAGSNMASLYNCILKISFPSQSTEFIQNFHSVLGPIVFAKSSLDTVSIADLLSIRKSMVEYIRKGLYSVLDIGESLRIHHQSFVDFVLDQDECPPPFRIDRRHENKALTVACFRAMEIHLRFNICNLRSSYVRNQDVSDLDLGAITRKSPHLIYSSCNWAGHLTETEFDDKTYEALQYFMDNQFLFWLEVLSLSKRVNIGSSMMRLSVSWMKKFGQDVTLAVDMQRFIVAFAGVISQSVPHIYISALPFAPRHSAVSRRYMVSYPQTLRIRYGEYRDWPAIQSVFNGHSACVKSVSFSPDGTRVASGSNDKTIRIWDTETGQTVIGPLGGHTQWVNSVSFSPDGTQIVSCSNDKTIRVWDAETGETLIGPLKGHTHWVNSTSFSPDGKRIVSGSYDKTIRVWDAKTGKTVVGPLKGHTGSITSVSFSPNGTRIASSSWDKTIGVWDAETGMIVVSLSRCNYPINSISFSPDGARIISGSWDKTIQLWDIKAGEMMIKPMEGHSYPINSISFSPDGTRIVSGSSDKTIRVWDAETGETVIGPLGGHTCPVNSVSFSPDSTRIISGSSDCTIRVWDAESGEIMAGTSKGHTDKVNSVSFSPSGTRIVSGSNDKTIRVWDSRTGKIQVEPLTGHTGSVNSVLFSPNGTHIISCSNDGTIRIWDAKTGETAIGPLGGHAYPVNSVSLSPDGTQIACGSDDGAIRVWYFKNGEAVSEPLSGHTDRVKSVSFSPNDKYIISCSNDRTIRIWDVETGKAALAALESSPRALESSPRASRLALSNEAFRTRVLNRLGDNAVTSQAHSSLVSMCSWFNRQRNLEGMKMEPLTGHTGSINSVSVSPDGKRMVSVSDDKIIRVWHALPGWTTEYELRGHTDKINSISFSPDGTRIVSGSSDKTVQVWELPPSETPTKPLRGHTSAVTSVSFSPDGTRIVSGSEDKTIRIWEYGMGTSKSYPGRVNPVSPSPYSTSASGPSNSIIHEPIYSIFREDPRTKDGWILGPNSELLFWVPPGIRSGLCPLRNTLVIGDEATQLDLTNFVHGDRWTRCRGRLN